MAGPITPTDDQVKEIEDLIGEALRLEKQNKPDEAKSKKQKAIHLVDIYYKIPDDHLP